MNYPDFSRSMMLLGKNSIDILSGKCVAVFGLGGVGSYVVEALARTGIGKFILVDNDVVTKSNINRQIIATVDTLGEQKTTLAKKRVLSINPMAEVETHEVFILPDAMGGVSIDKADYIVDAIDTVSAKLHLAKLAQEKNIPIISSMGTGNKLDPTKLCVSDISKTHTCPLARVMRRELSRRGITHLKVVFSTEQPIAPCENFGNDSSSQNAKKQAPGSVVFVPATAGLIVASEVVKDLLIIERSTNTGHGG